MTPDELYRDFVERYFEGGSSDVPADWPEDLRARCLFFLKVAEGGPAPAGERSVVAELSKAGVTSGVELEPPGGPPPPAPQAETGSGERYVFEGEIARGGMGRILLAYDRDFRRRIAVKVSLATAADRRRASRFLEEAQATAQLEHPNIPPVYDLGIDAKGSAYFTMRWIRGRNLKDIIAARTGELSLVRLVQILAQAAMGVHFAHTRGVIHRDLKPHNIMVGDYGEVLVVDWGLAKVLRRHGEPAEEEPPVSTARAEGEEPTLDGTVQGSLAYMAPEQAWGDTAAIDVRTDVFGLGAVLYEVLTGTPPRVQRSLPALLEAARLEEVEPPRQRAPSAGVPPQLEEAARKALALRKEDRYQSAKELHDALQAFI
ncbi:MAG: serine/threonine protein kinase, partial [Planctomycetes bacterium]|nr:serine/threonine protein kinase [Planctomycetota bacterium]